MPKAFRKEHVFCFAKAKAFALLGCGKKDKAEELLTAVRELDPYNFSLFVFDAQKEKIKLNSLT